MSTRPARSGTGTDWTAIARSEPFQDLERRRRRFTIAGLAVFFAAVAAFLVLVGYARGAMRSSVSGGFTVAFASIIALTLLAWVLVWLYLRQSERVWAPAARAIADEAGVEERR
jgi:uncharacterized membrane protein (DUF485 family)